MKYFTKLGRRSELQIRALLNLQLKQSVAVTTFCKAHKIHKATFYNWRNKYSGTPEKQPEFVPVRLAEAEAPALFAEIELSSKVCIRLFHKVDASYFKPLLQL